MMTEHMFGQFLSLLPSVFTPFAPFPVATDRKGWEEVPQYLKDAVLAEGRKVHSRLSAGSAWPVLLARDYIAFSRTGDRVGFEDKYFGRRNMLTLLVLSECISHTGEYIDDIADGIMLLCEESGWQLPPHNSYARDEPQLPLPDCSRPVIDLFACETAAQLAVTYYLLKPELDGVSPLICRRIEEEVNRRVTGPYQKEHFWWMGNGDEPMCNWTAWCTQNVLLAAFLLPQFESVRHAVVQQALYSLDCFVKDYGEDGCCSEGAEYYRHAGLCLFNAADILMQATGGVSGNVFAMKKIKAMAEYIMNMHVPHTGYYINFADCSPAAGRSGVREYLFGKKTGSSSLCRFASEEWSESSVKEKLLGCTAESVKGTNLYYMLQTLFTAREIDGYAGSCEKPEAELAGVRVWYESIGLFIDQKDGFTFAAKAGCNGDSHNHNDTGSIILYKDGKPFVIDLGVESYTKKTFSGHRYDIWTMQSAWHNLPTVNGFMQKDGREYAARDVLCKDDMLHMDIAGAYPREAGIASYIRDTGFAGGRTVVIRDRCTMDDGRNQQVQLTLMLCQKPDVRSASQTEIPVGSLGAITLKPDSGHTEVIAEAVRIDDKRLRMAWPDTVYRLLVTFTGGITVEFR